jgi:phosphoribosylanthranilate isomerase
LALAVEYGSSKGLLLDADSRSAKGGTGHAFDWALIPENCPLPIILAGGLNPGNVREALSRVRPYAVDVSSGVESEKGVKDAQKMAAFLEKIKQYDHGQPDN